MLDKRKRTKIKNNTIKGWRLEIASYSYTIQYRPGRENVGPDTLTHATCTSMTNSSSKFSDIHDQLCHPEITRLLHLYVQRTLHIQRMMPGNCATHVESVQNLNHSFTALNKIPHQDNSAHGMMEHRFQGTSQIIISEYMHAYYG